MARVFIDGFESGKMDLWDIISGPPSMPMSIEGMYGYACFINSFQYCKKNLPAAAEYYFAFKYRPYDGLGDTWQVKFYNGSTVLGVLARNEPDNVFKAFAGDSVTLLATGTLLVPRNVTVFVEVRYKPDSAAGVFQVKINNVLDINFFGNSGITANIDNVQFGCDIWGQFYFDDFVVDSAAWPGNSKIVGVVPTGAGSSTQWTPSAGANYACVDELPAVDTDFVSVNAVNQIDIYAAGTLLAPVEAVKCVQVQARCLKEGNPTPLNIQLVCRTYLVDYPDNVSKAVPIAARSFSSLWETNPNTLAAWTKIEVDDMEIGVKSVA